MVGPKPNSLIIEKPYSCRTKTKQKVFSQHSLSKQTSKEVSSSLIYRQTYKQVTRGYLGLKSQHWAGSETKDAVISFFSRRRWMQTEACCQHFGLKVDLFISHLHACLTGQTSSQQLSAVLNILI